MKWLIDNWSFIILLIAACVTVLMYINKFLNLPTDAQISAVKEWLLWACCQAEKELGSGTGRLKLRKVYSDFCTTFPWIAKGISFSTFDDWVTECLVTMRQMIESGSAVSTYINERKE